MKGSGSDRFAIELVDRLRRECERGRHRIAAFTQYNRQVEGWFKGELLMIAAEMERKGQIAGFTPDCRIDVGAGKQNIDLHFVLEDSRRVWIELKHWYLGRYASGARWNATAYFTQTTSATVNNFLSKLPKGWSDPTYMLIATTPKPTMDDWSNGFRRLNERHVDRRFRALTALEEFPDNYYLALLKV